MKKQGPLLVRSPAKINTCLRIIRRRADGYHEVGLSLIPVSIFDAMEFSVRPAPGIQLSVDSPYPLGAPEDNLVYRAAEGFFAAAGVAPAAEIRLTKHIPPGAGLGGGSGNAAAALLALNALAGNPLGQSDLSALALSLGSDVPFFLNPRPMWGSGRGERLQALPGFPTLPLVIVQPALSIDTGEAYRLISPREESSPMPVLDTPRAVIAALENDFQQALYGRHPELPRATRGLMEAGALGALLSGSGAASFGIFQDTAARDRGARLLRQDSEWTVYTCDTLPVHDYGLTAPARSSKH